MLHIHFSNHYEVLVEGLLALLDQRRGNVFEADQIVVPTTAVRRSLTLAIARAQGVCANVAFSYLAPWLWQQMGRLLPDVPKESPFAPDVLAWRILVELSDATWVSAHPRLAGYLGQADAVMRHELSVRLAGLLDQYITYRPDWLEAWRRGDEADVGARNETDRADERWQAALWSRLTAAADAPALASGSAFIEALGRIDPAQAAAAGLPAVVHVFALPTMPAQQIAWLMHIAQVIEVHLHVLNPCQEYWFELIDRRRLSHLAARGRAAHHEVGHRLLAAWGRQTQAHVDGLVDSAGPGATDEADFRPNGSCSLLGRLQDSILNLAELPPGSVRLTEVDRSVELHVCHSRTRELEVLQDHLLGLFASGAVQHPSQVLVVTPDLDAAAPLIDAVFGTAPRERHIPYTVSGRARSTVNPPARALLGLLSLMESRFTASGVFGLLQQDIVARRFGLDRNGLDQIHAWLLDSGTRWGLDGANRASFGVPDTSAHTWSDGLDRLFLGYALPTRIGLPFAGRLPSGDAEGADALLLGALWQFIDRLRELHDKVSTPGSPERWCRLLVDVVEDFMAPESDELDDQAELLSAIRVLCDTMARGGLQSDGAPPMPLAVVHAALVRQLDDPMRGAVPTGSVTFSSMNSLRSLPYDVVCVIGLDDGLFPTVQRPLEFDLMACRPRRGDRQRGNDERNLFLDLLLAARHSLYLSHVGRSVRDNSVLPPSVLVAELLDLLLPAIAEDPAAPDSLGRARRRLVIEHPLQPFSIEAFHLDGDRRLHSHHREMLEALRASLGTDRAVMMDLGLAADEPDGMGNDSPDADIDVVDVLPAFFTEPLAPPGPEWREVSVGQLVEFFRNPCRYLLRRRLGIDLSQGEEELQDDEPFLPDWLARQALAERLLPPLLDGASAQAVRELALAGRELPAGALGRQLLERELGSLSAFAESVRARTAGACLPPHPVRLTIDVDGEHWQLGAGFADLRPEGLVRWRCDDRRPGDVLAAWIAHLTMCSAPPSGMVLQTLWLSLDGAMRLGSVDRPLDHLRDLLRIYRQGLSEPIAFYPKAAWSFLENDESWYTADQVWTPTRDRPFAERADPAYRLALRGRDPTLGMDFAEMARRVFGPVRAVLYGTRPDGPAQGA